MRVTMLVGCTEVNMRRNQIVVVLISSLSVSLLLSSCGKTLGEKQNRDKYTRFPERLAPSDYPVTCFDRYNLPVSTTVIYLVNPTTKSMKITGGDIVSDPFEFYCEQAIWDGLIQIENNNLPLKPFTTTFKTNPAHASNHKTIEETYLQEYPKQRRLVAVIRIIPLAAAKLFPNAITENEINSLPNLSAIKINDLHSEKLENYREDWFRLMQRVNKKIDRDGLSAEAANLYRKHKELFVDEPAKG
jgi:hypothetical protein